jgi:asparagine synthase (glutamine-hydrolysing)
MCGIAGISGWKRGPEELTRALQAMQKALGHRGPDDRGLLTDPQGRWGLAHTRLSILDLSPCGRQPMTSADGQWHLVFNGEIYNYRDLRSSLEKAGHRFRSTGDTEVLLETLVREGPTALEKFRGMFAFGLLHATDGRVLLARDTFGIKPLYTAIGPDGELLFASEVRALLAAGRIPKRINPAGIDGYLRTGSLPYPHSVVAGIHQHRSGTWAEYVPGAARPGDLLPVSYFRKISFPAEDLPPAGPELTRRVRDALAASLEAHFVSDVPVGLFLSGGIDSTAVAALAAASGRKGLRSYSLGYREGDHDESGLTRRVARRFGMEHHLLRLGPDNARELFLRYLDAMDQPTLDGFNTFCVSSLAAADGTKVVLSGLGGDELFGGYGSFYRVPDLTRWARRHGSRPRLGALLETLPSARFRRVAEMLAQPPSLEQTFTSYRGNFTQHESAALRRRLGAEGPAWRNRADVYGADGEVDRARFPTDTDVTGYLELSRYMKKQLLKDSDVFSMTHGLELRVPLVDTGLFSAIQGLPASDRYQLGKKLFVSAVPEIPDYVWNHPKKGFTLPVDRWMHGPWRDLFADTRRRFRGVLLEPSYRLWSLKTLTHWLEKHGFEARD